MKRRRRKAKPGETTAQELRAAPIFEYTMLDVAFAIAGLELEIRGFVRPERRKR